MTELRNERMADNLKYWFLFHLKKKAKLIPESSEEVDLFVCLGFFVSIENFSLIWRRHFCRWRAANFDLCLALMVIEQWRFFSVPHLLWHGASVYNGHLRGHMTFTSIAALLAVELSLPVFTIKIWKKGRKRVWEKRWPELWRN